MSKFMFLAADALGLVAGVGAIVMGLLGVSAMIQ